jgi:hypothetical protein
MKMSDERREYDTGAVRSADCEQTRYDLISPIGLRALAKTYAEGSSRFGFCNWENGMPVTDLLNHAIAHVYNFLEGDRAEDHLAHAAWNLLGAIHSMEMWPHLNQEWLRGPGCSPAPAATATNATQPAPAKPEQPEQQAQPTDCRPPVDSNFEELRRAVFSKPA